MDGTDDRRPQPQPSQFHEAVFAFDATSPSDTLLVYIRDFGDQPFGDPGGVVWSPMGGALPRAGDRALVAESDDGSWWVLAWWSANQTDSGSLTARVGALEATRTVRGTVSATGTIVSGSGFSVSKTGTGTYTVTFTTAFSGTPTVIASPAQSPAGVSAYDVEVTSPSTTGFGVTVREPNVAFIDCNFGFIAEGPA